MTYRNPFLTSIIRDMIDIRKEGIPPEINLRTTSLLLLFLQLLLLPFLNLVMLFSINKVPQNNPFSFLFVKIYVKVWASLLDLRISKLHSYIGSIKTYYVGLLRLTFQCVPFNVIARYGEYINLKFTKLDITMNQQER